MHSQCHLFIKKVFLEANIQKQSNNMTSLCWDFKTRSTQLANFQIQLLPKTIHRPLYLRLSFNTSPFPPSYALNIICQEVKSNLIMLLRRISTGLKFAFAVSSRDLHQNFNRDRALFPTVLASVMSVYISVLGTPCHAE